MADGFCPQCGVQRRGEFRFCASCGFDFWKAAQAQSEALGLATAATPPPVSPVMAQPLQPAPATARRRPWRKWLVWGLAVFVALAVLGTVFGRPEDELATAASDRPSATERPTAEPTAEPTERETPQPTVNTDQRELQAFSAHVVGFAETFVDDLQGIMADAEALDVDALSQSSVAMWVNLGEEQSWVANHVPAACYEEMYDAYSDMIDTYYEAMDLISDGAIYYDVDLINQGANLMEIGNAEITHTTALAEQVSCP